MELIATIDIVYQVVYCRLQSLPLCCK